MNISSQSRSLSSAIQHVEHALKNSPKCTCGLVGQQRVFGIEQGPSGGPELLATLYIDDPFFGFFYGHVQLHPNTPQKFVALIVWADQFINADRTTLLFKRFHYWIKERLKYHPCAIQNADDAYDECPTLESAASALSRMITRFDFDKRSGIDGSGFEESQSELRILGIYGLAGIEDNKELAYPPVPMPTELKLVKALG